MIPRSGQKKAEALNNEAAFPQNKPILEVGGPLLCFPSPASGHSGSLLSLRPSTLYGAREKYSLPFLIHPKYVMVWLRIAVSLTFPCLSFCTWKSPLRLSGTGHFCRETVTAPWSHLNADVCLLEMTPQPLATSALNMGTRRHGITFASGSRPIGASALVRVIIDALITKAGSLRCQE